MAGFMAAGEVLSDRETRTDWRRNALALMAAHLLAILLDWWLRRWLGDGRLFLTAMMHCDAALLGLWAGRQDRFPWKMMGLCAIGSGSVFPGEIFRRQFTTEPLAQLIFAAIQTFPPRAMLVTLIQLPLVVLACWAAVRERSRIAGWVAFTGVILLSLGGLGQVLLTTDFIQSRSRVFWGDNWAALIVAFNEWVINLAAIFVCAWVVQTLKRRRGIRRAIIGLTAVEGVVVICSLLAAIEARYQGFYSWALGKVLDQFFNGLLWQLSIPAISGAVTLLSTLAFIPIVNRQAEMDSDLLDGQQISKEMLSGEARRRQFWKMAGFALGISCLNLILGFTLEQLQCDRSPFGSRGLLFEMVFIAPVGLWSAQMAASALFLQCNIWNGVKRTMLVLGWAEVSMVAFWGQIALSTSVHGSPSDYVGTVLHCLMGALLIAAGERLLRRKGGERFICSGFSDAGPMQKGERRFSLSLGDIICLVTVSAGLAYPMSVVFAVEQWHSFRWVIYRMSMSAGWPIVAGAASYFLLRQTFRRQRHSLGNLAAALVCFAGCTAFDAALIQGVSGRWFFETRPGAWTMGIPSLLLTTAILAIGLKWCGVEMEVVEEKELVETEATGSEPAAVALEKSPWD